MSDELRAGPWDRPTADGRGEPRGEGRRSNAGVAEAAEAGVESALERRRLRRKLMWWRLGGLALLALIGFGVYAANTTPVGPHIARFEVTGVIVDDPTRDKLLADIAANDSIEALIVRIDSPGGTTVGGEALYESLRRVAERKPVVAVMGEVAASAGYITALAADHLVARGNTITASIGVIMAAPNFSGALDRLGISVVEIKSGEQKAEPAPYKPVDPAVLEAERVLIDDSFQWFLGLVEERRALDAAGLERIRDGRILTGRMALQAGLIDELGDEASAVDWLQSERGLAVDLPIVDHAVPTPDEGLLGALVGDITRFDAAQRFLTGPRLYSKAF